MTADRLMKEAARYFLAGLLGLLMLYCFVLVIVGFAAALTAPIWIWWCI